MGNYITALEWAKGNPGAMSFLMELNRQDEETAKVITECLVRNWRIRGTSLYVLWSDLCNQDIDKVRQLCENCPDQILAYACSRQDYSGRELVNQYFKS